MAEKRKDNKGRNLRTGETQMPDGRYRFIFGEDKKAVYSWKLVPTDRIPQGKRDDISLREKEEEIEKAKHKGLNIRQSKKMTLNDVFNEYMSTKGKLKENSKERYYYLWNLRVADYLGKTKIADLKKAHVLKFYTKLHEDGYSDSTIRMYHNNLINMAVEFAVDNDIIAKNPLKGCADDYNERKTRTALTNEEQETFLQYVKEHSHYQIYYPMFRVMIGTACRISELCGLTWNDIDMINRKITIDHQLLYKPRVSGMQFRIETPKTESGNRVIPMTDDVYRALQEQKRIYKALGYIGSFEVEGYRDFVFLNSVCRPYHNARVNEILRGIVESYNKQHQDNQLPHISCHTLRHTGCTRFAERGMDVKVLATAMGHKSTDITMKVYNHVDDERMMKEFIRIESAV